MNPDKVARKHINSGKRIRKTRWNKRSSTRRWACWPQYPEGFDLGWAVAVRPIGR
jgi:hypothetical protein